MKIPPIALAGLAGIVALVAFSGSAKAADASKAAEGPGNNPGGDPPPLPAGVGKLMKSRVDGQPAWTFMLSALGYAAPSSSAQIQRFQAQYNMVSRTQSGMGGVDVTGVVDDKTLQAIFAALAESGGESYVNAELNPFFAWARGQEFANEDEADMAALLMDTSWLDSVRNAAESFGQWMTVEWIDAGADPDWKPAGA